MFDLFEHSVTDELLRTAVHPAFRRNCPNFVRVGGSSRQQFLCTSEPEQDLVESLLPTGACAKAVKLCRVELLLLLLLS